MSIPENVKYARTHEWVRIEGTTAWVGITDYAQGELGDIVFVDVTARIDDEISAGETFGTIEAVKTVSDVYLPVNGRIAEINSAIAENPEIINSDPFGNGWIVRITVADNVDASALMDAAAYRELVGA